MLSSAFAGEDAEMNWEAEGWQIAEVSEVGVKACVCQCVCVYVKVRTDMYTEDFLMPL